MRYIDTVTVFATMYKKNVLFLGKKMQEYNDSEIAEAIQTLTSTQDYLIEKMAKDALADFIPNAKSDE